MTYRIKDWDSLYENSRTRELKKLDFVLVPNRHDSDSFTTLMGMPKATALFGAWVLILQVASKCEPRGVLVRSNGDPHTPESIGRMTGADEKIIREALDVLSSREIGWLEALEDDETFVIPPARLASADDKARAHGRIDRLLKSGAGVSTPKGQVTQRPSRCQWCEENPGADAKGVTNIRAHHFLSYGSKQNDSCVLFVCRSCHGFFESGKFTTRMILERFGTSWLPQDIAASPQSTACDSGAPASSRARDEQNGIEGKGIEEPPTPCAPCGAVVEIPSRHAPLKSRKNHRSLEEIRRDLGIRLPWFEALCSVHPAGKDGVKAGAEAFERKVCADETGHALAQEMYRGAKAYADRCQRDPTVKIKWMQGWINDERWRDENRIRDPPSLSQRCFTSDVAEVFGKRMLEDGKPW